MVVGISKFLAVVALQVFDSFVPLEFDLKAFAKDFQWWLLVFEWC